MAGGKMLLVDCGMVHLEFCDLEFAVWNWVECEQIIESTLPRKHRWGLDGTVMENK